MTAFPDKTSLFTELTTDAGSFDEVDAAFTGASYDEKDELS